MAIVHTTNPVLNLLRQERLFFIQDEAFKKAVDTEDIDGAIKRLEAITQELLEQNPQRIRKIRRARQVIASVNAIRTYQADHPVLQ